MKRESQPINPTEVSLVVKDGWSRLRMLTAKFKPQKFLGKDLFRGRRRHTKRPEVAVRGDHQDLHRKPALKNALNRVALFKDSQRTELVLPEDFLPEDIN